MEKQEHNKVQAWKCFQEAHTAQSEGSLEQAIHLYQESLSIYPTAEAYTFLGWSYSNQGWFDPAINLCRQAIQVDPSYGNPYNDIGAYLIEQGQLDEAIPWLEEALHAKRYDSYCFPWMNLGRIWQRKGRWLQALECYKKALACDPKYTTAARAVARLQSKLN